MSYDYNRANAVRKLVQELVSDSLEAIAERIYDVEAERDTYEEQLKEANERIAELEAEQAA
jgi:vacuolar-type H+-ATPase subunit I/STV1